MISRHRLAVSSRYCAGIFEPFAWTPVPGLSIYRLRKGGGISPISGWILSYLPIFFTVDSSISSSFEIFNLSDFFFNKIPYKYMASPCKNFCFLGAIKIIDPKDGRQKSGTIIFCFKRNWGIGVYWYRIKKRRMDRTSRGWGGAWALFLYDNKELLVDTCGTQGFLHCLDCRFSN